MAVDETPRQATNRTDSRTETVPVLRLKSIYIQLDRDIAREKDMVQAYRMMEEWINGLLPEALDVSLALARSFGKSEKQWKDDMDDMRAVQREFLVRDSPVPDAPRVNMDTGDTERYQRYFVSTDPDAQASEIHAEDASSLVPALHLANREVVSHRGISQLVNWRFRIKVVLKHYGLWGLKTESASMLSPYGAEDRERDFGPAEAVLAITDGGNENDSAPVALAEPGDEAAGSEPEDSPSEPPPQEPPPEYSSDDSDSPSSAPEG